MNAQELVDILNKVDNKDAQIQCVVWDGRLECEVGYDLCSVDPIDAGDQLIFFKLTGS